VIQKLVSKIKHIVNYFQKTIKKLRDPYWRAKCNYIKYYEKLPIRNNVILFESQNATKVDGNIFYMIRYISSSKKYSEFEICLSSWGRYASKIRSLLDHYSIDNVNIVVYSSDEYVRLLASAKYLINDATFPFYFIKKEGQIYLNTWHGTPLKAMGRSTHNDVQFGNVQKNMLVSDYLLYTNDFSKEIFIRDYMLENISSGSYIMSGYPRNDIFFDDDSRDKVRDEMNLEGKRIYAYMPTWRGTINKIGSSKERTYLLYFFYELDKRLTDDEILYINLHPMAMHAKDNVALKSFRHIKRFPSDYETYDFLNAADVLITDYSSVFFDFACTHRKIVLFPYDKDEYLQDRGMYFSMDELPFPQVFDVPSLLRELRSGKSYDDTQFVEEFNPYDGSDSSERLCDFTILGEKNGIVPLAIPDNGKENVLLYAGNLSKNGITTSLRSLLNYIDTGKRNYIISFCQGKARRNAEQLSTFNPNVSFLAIAEYADLTIGDRIIRKLYKEGWIKAKIYMKKAGKRFDQEWLRAYGNARIDTAIQFCGYEDEITLLYSRFAKRNIIFIHNDMVKEIETRRTQRTDVLQYAYNSYSKVVTVSEDIIPPTIEISGNSSNISVVHNVIDDRRIQNCGKDEIHLEESSSCSVSGEYFHEIMESSAPKYINIGRFSPEKGHERLIDAFSRFLSDGKDAYLIIMGGNSLGNGYSDLKGKISEMGLEERVVLLLNVSNPYPILKACDYFIMSSFYEGLPMTLFEADIFEKPIVSTDVRGPHGFLSKYGGTLVEDSEEGIFQGLNMLYEHQVGLLSISYPEYNSVCVEEFERLFG
jgi:CDP-glycerol glycerophosphotransferase